jgi:hypothetical protein
MSGFWVSKTESSPDSNTGKSSFLILENPPFFPILENIFPILEVGRG